MQDRAAAYFADVQDRACALLERLDGGARFREDRWEREGGGGGRARVLAQGAVFERVGVNVSEVFGELRPDFAATMPGDGTRFWAAGVSLIAHPRSPMVPTVHMNERVIRRGAATWFGGGADLTPCYVVDEDARAFHRALRAACDRSDPAYYPKFKKACDEYFFLAHRKEPRGIGGIFFDTLRGDADALFALHEHVADALLGVYGAIVAARRDAPFGEHERAWQLLRRGRYVEFNLLYDRGTRFGLETGGRAESILVSLPPLVRWDEGARPEPGSAEEASLAKILERRDWAAQ